MWSRRAKVHNSCNLKDNGADEEPRDCNCPCHSGGVVAHPVPCCDGFLRYLRRNLNSQLTVILTSRLGTGVAIALTVFVFAQAVRDVLLLVGPRPSLLLPLEFLLHGWPLVAAIVVFYGYLCWLAFWVYSRHSRAVKATKFSVAERIREPGASFADLTWSIEAEKSGFPSSGYIFVQPFGGDIVTITQ